MLWFEDLIDLIFLSTNRLYLERRCICAMISRTPLSDTEKCVLERKEQ